MSSLTQSFTPFYQLVSQLEASSKPIGQKRQQLEALIAGFQARLEQIGKALRTTLGTDSTSPSTQDTQMHQNMSQGMSEEIGALVSMSMQGMQDKVKCWLDEFEAQAKRERFEAQFENSFIIIIYGKVKAGKSSLSNFVARHCLSDQEARFYCYERASQTETESSATEMRERAFKVDITECTAEIQYFTLGSKGAGQTEGKIVWVDTPGLASTTDAYGDLARKYIQSAHYIIFPLSSGAPLTQDEQRELDTLIQLGKADNIRLLITKSDEIIKDENEQGQLINVLKNKDTRADQESATLKTLRDLGIELHHEPLSISVRSAEFALNESEESLAKLDLTLQESKESLFDGSNMGEFYDSLAIDLQKRAKDLAQNAPTKTLKALIENITKGVKIESAAKGAKNQKGAMSQSLESLKKDYENIQKHIVTKQREAKNAKIELESNITAYINEQFALHAPSLSSLPVGDPREKVQYITPQRATTKSQLFQAINDEIARYALDIVQQRLQEIFRDFRNRLQVLLPSVDVKIEDRYVEYEHEKERGWIERIANAINSDWCAPEYTTKRVRVGDTTQEVINKNIDNLTRSYKDIVQEYLHDLDRQLFAPCLALSKELEQEIGTLESDLLALQKSL